MCGITGVINFKGKTSNVIKSLVEMTNSMYDRGPDNEGYFGMSQNKIIHMSGKDSIVDNLLPLESFVNHPFKLAFGFRQLKIIDMSTASHQPMTDIEERYVIVFNGELYNYIELRKELKTFGYKFKTNSDTEVVLNAFKKWSVNCLEKFNGMFGFAIYDVYADKVFIARDRMGIKPLFISVGDSHIVFGSTQKSILASENFKKKVDREGLWQNFRFSTAQRPNTCFEGIKAVKPASYLLIDVVSGDITEKIYWNLPVGTQNFSLTEKQAVDLLEEELFKSIEYRLRADVEVGAFMSGGVDSTLISAMASKLNPSIKAITLGFENYEQFNEIKEAQDSAAINNLTHVIDTIDPFKFINGIEKNVIAYEEPYHQLSANFAISSLAKQNGLKVVLSGLGGDELFGGYDVYYKLPFWEKYKLFSPLANLIPGIHPKVNKVKSILGYKNIGEFYSHYYSTFSDKQLSQLFNSSNYNTKSLLSDLYIDNKLEFTDHFEALSYFNLKSYIGNHQLRSIDSATMSCSIEGRIPMLDHNFIAAGFKIPTALKNKNGIQKYILRKLASKYIAPSCLEMKKKGLGLPLNHWINNELKNYVGDHIHDLKRRYIYNNQQVDKIVAEGEFTQIWQLVSTEIWYKNLVDHD